MGNPNDAIQKLRTMLIEATGITNVYFDPPPTTILSYPCILIGLSAPTATRANNLVYTTNLRFSVTYVTKTPDMVDILAILCLKSCRYDREYSADSLKHFVYTITL